MSKNSQIINRQAVVAGTFYPGSKKELKKELKQLFASVESNQSSTSPRAIISPHAGYIYSGKVAAAAFNLIPEKTNYKRIFVLASSHRFHFKGASVYSKGNYETPLGEIKVDTELAKDLCTSSAILSDDTEAHLHEHSLEVQLPFMQYRLKKLPPVVPILLGTNNAEDCRVLAEILQPYFLRENLFVISTDFSHYPNYDDACTTDKSTADVICQNNPENLLAFLKQTKEKGIRNLATALCGWTSVLSLLYLTQNQNVRYQLIDYKNSGDSVPLGDKSRVVGYYAISVAEKQAFEFADEEKAEIVRLARQSICKFLGQKSESAPDAETNILKQKAGVFISVYVNNKLRGCIGGFAQDKSLKNMIKEMSVSAVCDRRFKNVEKDELPNMKLEVSVLSPLKKISSIDEFELGKHGIYIQSGLNKGTFLPQVAEKYNWTKEEFLGKCSKDKAGIGWDGWKNAELFTYEAVIIREE